MVPEFIGQESWSGILRLLVSLWAFVFFWVSFALSMLMAQAVIPSLVTSRHISARFQSLRPILYVVAAIGFIGAIFFIANAVGLLTVIYSIYDRRAI
jgi:hypothetical protein